MTHKKKKLSYRIGGSLAVLVATWRLFRTDKPNAEHPHHLPLASWKRALLDTLQDLNDKNTGVLAAGIAYFASLAFFPILAAFVAIASIVIQPGQIESTVTSLNAYLPQDIASLISTQLKNQTGQYSGNVIVAAIAIIISLIGAAAAVENTIRALNVAYDVRETRNIVKLRALSVLLLMGAIFVAIVIALLLLSEEFLLKWGVPGFIVQVIDVVRWPVLLVIIGVATAVLYRYGANRPTAKWRWVSWGATIATALLLVVTVGLFLYTRYFATFSQSYSLFAGIVVLMTWFNLSAFALLIGAQINARLEQRTSATTSK